MALTDRQPLRTSRGSTVVVVRIALLAAALVATVYYGVVSDAALPDHPLIRNYNDLVMHFAAFAMVTVLAMIGRTGSIAIVLLLAMFAIAIEFAQWFDPAREATLSDFVASLAGIAAGWLMAVIAGAAITRLAPKTNRTR